MKEPGFSIVFPTSNIFKPLFFPLAFSTSPYQNQTWQQFLGGFKLNKSFQAEAQAQVQEVDHWAEYRFLHWIISDDYFFGIGLN